MIILPMASEHATISALQNVEVIRHTLHEALRAGNGSEALTLGAHHSSSCGQARGGSGENSARLSCVLACALFPHHISHHTCETSFLLQPNPLAFESRPRSLCCKGNWATGVERRGFRPRPQSIRPRCSLGYHMGEQLEDTKEKPAAVDDVDGWYTRKYAQLSAEAFGKYISSKSLSGKGTIVPAFELGLCFCAVSGLFHKVFT